MRKPSEITKQTAWRTLIVDDETPARRLIAKLLHDMPNVEVVGECRNGTEAIEAIKREEPDLVILDVQMPGADGFEVIRQIGVTKMPAVVFVTAFDQYAVRAFEVHAVDYLLKPYSRDRFREAITRVDQQLRQAKPRQSRLQSLLRELQGYPTAGPAATEQPGKISRLLIRSQDRIVQINLKDIVWLESADHYVLVHTASGRQLVYQALSAMENDLPGESFVRVHRGAIINVSHVAKVAPSRFGAYLIQMTTGEQLRLSRARRDLLPLLLSRIPS